ncbi:MAG: M56 family metallopeptidase, partial [Oscillospiraceae bacterium]|nr:M56 family metallopeptidase [Oscillospiraceae bacterium]
MDKLTWILSSCVLIAAVAAIRALFGKKLRPGVRYALWLLVLIRLLYPGTVAQSPVSVPAAAARTEIVQNVEALRGVQSIEHMANGSVEGMPRYELMPDRPVTVTPQPVTPERFARMQTTLKARDLILPIWYAGIAVTTVVFAATNLRFYSDVRARRRRIEADCPIPVYAVENLASSCLFGRAVYVAAETAQDETQLRHVLSHELSHYRHGDWLWSLLRCAALAIHWYNPLVWWAAKLSRQDSELFADAGALSRLGEDERENYGVTLIRLSARHETKAPLLCAATTMTNGKAALRERVTMIARRPRMTAAVLAAVLLIAAVAAGCTFTGAKKTPDNTPIEAQIETISPAELRWFNEEFFKHWIGGDEDGHLNLHLQFLSSTYAAPEDVDLFELFYCGTGEVAEPLSADEQERFGSTECPTDKLSTSAMDAVFYENTGMHLDETKKIGLDKFVYSPDYDAYYNTHGDSNYRGQVTLHGGTREGKLVHLYYEDMFYGDGWKCVTLREAGAGEWHFVSNLPCEKPALPTSYPAGEPWKT